MSRSRYNRISVLSLFLVLSLALGACTSGGPGGPAEETVISGEITEQVPTTTAAATEMQPTEVIEPTALPGQTDTAPPSEPTATTAAEATEPAGGGETVTTFPDPAQFQWAEVVTGLTRPVHLTSSGDGSQRIFILEQPGRIRIFSNGQLLPEPFLDIVDKVGSQGNEQGLLGMAFHPNYPDENAFFINYTDLNGDTVVARYRVGENPDLALRDSEEVLFTVDQPFPNHNGGGVEFGPDGFLYLSLGDGGSAGDPEGNAQNLDTLLGKILRIDVNTTEGYQVPGDNPFAGGGGLPEIWFYGLRNPWRFSFDSQTGDMYIADVGQNAYEEIDFWAAGQPAGANFGWDYREGAHPYEGEPPADAELVDPVFEYAHGEGCSVTGGYVYRGAALPEWNGIYLFGDYCTGFLWGLLRGADGSFQTQRLFETGRSISAFGLDEQGEIYLMDLAAGAIYQFVRQ